MILLSLEDLAKLAIDRSLEYDADYAEFRYHIVEEEMLMLRNGVFKAFKKSYSEGYGIRVLLNGVFSFSSSDILTESGVVDVVDRAIKSVKASEPLVNRKVSLYEGESHEVKYLVTENKKWINTSYRDKLDILKGLDDEIKDSLSIFTSSIRFIGLGWRRDIKIIANSLGTYIQSTIPLVWIKFGVTIVESGDNIQKVSRLGGSGGLEVINNLKIEKRILESINELKNIFRKREPSPRGKMDVVVGSEIAGIIAHECIGHPFEADRILGREGGQAGESYLTYECIGRQVGSEEVNVSDDPTMPMSGGYYLFDDEGVKARKKRLVVEGRVNELLHNRETAASFQVDSNGSARSTSYNREPIIRMSNTYFEPGDYSLSELIEDVQSGLYIKGYMEWNIDDRRVNQRYTGLEAYFIENGEIKYPVKNPVLEVTTDQLLKSLDARGRDLAFNLGSCGKGAPPQSIPVWFGGPSLRFRKINVERRA